MPTQSQSPISQPDPANLISNMAFHGPYEDAIIAVAKIVGVIIEGQDPEFRKEMGSRFLEVTKPLHDSALRISEQIAILTTPIQIIQKEK